MCHNYIIPIYSIDPFTKILTPFCLWQCAKQCVPIFPGRSIIFKYKYGTLYCFNIDYVDTVSNIPYWKWSNEFILQLLQQNIIRRSMNHHIQVIINSVVVTCSCGRQLFIAWKLGHRNSLGDIVSDKPKYFRWTCSCDTFIWHKINHCIIISFFAIHVFSGVIFDWILHWIVFHLICGVPGYFKLVCISIDMTDSTDGKNENPFFLSSQMILSGDIPIPLLLVLLKHRVNFPQESTFAMYLLAPRPLTPSWWLRSVITYLITLLSYSHIAHCSARLSGCCWVFSVWSLTIPFNVCSSICPEKIIHRSKFQHALWHFC